MDREKPSNASPCPAPLSMNSPYQPARALDADMAPERAAGGEGATGVDMGKLIDAGGFICRELGRETLSRAARAIAARPKTA